MREKRIEKNINFKNESSKKEALEIISKWDSADLNRGPSVPNARGWTKLPYYPKGYLLTKEIILYIAFVRTWICCSFSAHRNSF